MEPQGAGDGGLDTPGPEEKAMDGGFKSISRSSSSSSSSSSDGSGDEGEEAELLGVAAGGGDEMTSPLLPTPPPTRLDDGGSAGADDHRPAPPHHHHHHHHRPAWRRLLRRCVPMSGWVRGYSRADLGGDVVAGLTVATMVVPQGMSYAVLAGLPPVYGLFSAMTPPLAYTLLGSSKHLSIGPVALVSLSLQPVLRELGVRDPQEAAAMVTSITLVAGLTLALLGLLRLGNVVRVIPPAVMLGFTTAGALSIGVSQLKNLLGLSVPDQDYTYQTLAYILSHLQHGRLPSLVVGLCCMALLVANTYAKSAVQRFAHRPYVHAALRTLRSSWTLVVVVAALGVGYAQPFGPDKLPIVGPIPNRLPSPRAPSLRRAGPIVVHSLSIVLLAFMEGYAIARTYARLGRYTLHINQELVALGACNVLGSFFSSYPVSGSFSRTAVNVEAGARTPLANAVMCVVVLCVLPTLSWLFQYIPMAALGAIIEVALWGLLDFRACVAVLRRGPWALESWDLLLTFVPTLVLNTETGLLCGMAWAALTAYFNVRAGGLLFEALVRPRVVPSDAPTDRCHIVRVRVARIEKRTEWVQDLLPKYVGLMEEEMGGGHGGTEGPLRTLLLVLDAGGMRGVGVGERLAKLAELASSGGHVHVAVVNVAQELRGSGSWAALNVVEGGEEVGRLREYGEALAAREQHGGKGAREEGGLGEEEAGRLMRPVVQDPATM